MGSGSATGHGGDQRGSQCDMGGSQAFHGYFKSSKRMKSQEPPRVQGGDGREASATQPSSTTRVTTLETSPDCSRVWSRLPGTSPWA